MYTYNEVILEVAFPVDAIANNRSSATGNLRYFKMPAFLIV